MTGEINNLCFKKYKYSVKIKALCEYFNITKNAAKYILHRRRRGYPWKTVGCHEYLEWSIPIQNAFIQADNNPSINWRCLKFSEDIDTLKKNDIVCDYDATHVYINDTDIPHKSDDWVVINSANPLDISDTTSNNQMLKNIGFFIRNK